MSGIVSKFDMLNSLMLRGRIIQIFFLLALAILTTCKKDPVKPRRSGHLIKSITLLDLFSPDSLQYSRTEWVYDSDNYLVETMESDTTVGFNRRTYEYDDYGNLIKLTMYDPRDSLLGTETYEYENGRCVKITHDPGYSTRYSYRQDTIISGFYHDEILQTSEEEYYVDPVTKNIFEIRGGNFLYWLFYDNKINPYKQYNFPRPTSLNNETMVIHGSDTTEYHYTYDSLDYPTIKNSTATSTVIEYIDLQ